MPVSANVVVNVERHEIVNIILDSPNGKKPGPDGLPAAFLKRYCHQTGHHLSRSLDRACVWTCTHRSCAYVFRFSRNGLWVPKMEGANTIDKLRDLKLGNEVRKVLARMLFKVLDEVCPHESHGLCHAQQAFVTGRDIIRNTTVVVSQFLGHSRRGC